jgi:pyruvate/2-oxoglutarate dehydrogenase complex dihydrolipoamide dehydrogenase (E3) component
MDSKKKSLSADFCIIGGGSGGLSFAAGAVQMGASVILLEERKMGGDCLNYGCVPSKALIAAARFGQEIKQAIKFGWAITDAQVDYAEVHKHIHKVISNIEPNDSVKRFEALGVKVILESGKFLDRCTLETESYLIKAKRFIIATGSIPFTPPIEGLAAVPYYTNESIFDLKELPKRLVVIGGGPIGIELAQAFHNLGSTVTVLEAFTALPKDDPVLTSKLKQILNNSGIDIKEHVKISSVKQIDNQLHISYVDANNQSTDVLATHILVATGRRPNIAKLNLDAAGIKYLPQGIVVSNILRTSNTKVYAIGDCTGGYQFTHVAGYHAGLAIRNSIFKLGTKVQTKATPWVTYSDPELAHVGLLEAQLIQQKIAHKVLSLTFAENDRAQTENNTEGLIKILVTPKGYILGASILGPQAGELIFPWVIAIQNKLKISAIANSIAPYPTLCDINKRIAGSFYTDKIFSPMIRRIVTLLMKLRT